MTTNQNRKNLIDEMAYAIESDVTLSDKDKATVLRNLAGLKETKVNILVTGATGCGKSSTINALFNTDKAQVGQGVDPQTMDIQKYELNNVVLFDSPGLGDGKEADLRHAKNITDKLYEKGPDGNSLIDLVLVILDGSSRDLGTSFELINNVVIPALGKDTGRLLVAINQADVAMKGKNWDHVKNCPEPTLVKFLDDKVASTRKRIKETTGVDIEPIYFSAGYKDGDASQNPYNLSKLLAFILRHTKQEKRAVFAQDMNQDKKVWKDDDKQSDYREEIKQSMWESVKSTAGKGASLGGALGAVLGPKGAAVGAAIGTVLGAAWGALTSWW